MTSLRDQTAEWLLTDGLGGYAMGTPSLLRTRSYHSLLTSRDADGASRAVLLALDPVLVIGGDRHELTAREWSDGRRRDADALIGFELIQGVPRWRWHVDETVLELEMAMAHGVNALAAVYRLVSGGPARLEVEVLLPASDGDGTVPVVADGATFVPADEVVRGIHYREEAARGLPATAEARLAGRFVAELAAGQTVELLAGEPRWLSLSKSRLDDPFETLAGSLLRAAPSSSPAIIAEARARYTELARTAGVRNEVEETLIHAADQFVIAGPDVIAGYPWFGCWSRDTLTAYEGLFLATNRWDEGAALLRRLTATVDAGQLVNTTDFGGGEYNTVDAAIWLLFIVGRHWEVTGDLDLARELLPGLQQVVDGYRAGTRFGIRVDHDALITQGADGWALTWMDARVDGVAITPRIGKPVEVNALWVAGLWYLASIQEALGVEAEPTWRLHASAAAAFSRFVAPSGLFDVIDGPAGDEASLRPNQLLAGVRHGPFSGDDGRIEARWAEHLASACAPLITPLGPRSLGPDEPGYAARFDGDMHHRDSVYHQGTVWPWLIGAWADIAAAAGRPIDLGGLIDHLGTAGLGSVTEVADGDAPHHPGGCPFQAWSVAELLRVVRTSRGQSAS